MSRYDVYDVEDLENIVQNVNPEYKEDVRMMTFEAMKHEAYNNPE